ncbi:MAG: epoxyqueuosine reductase [Deltaproteobacteria bacterium]|nr:epoxyqueuosine reductase [Candidatus Zymogenaceae bacterium]
MNEAYATLVRTLSALSVSAWGIADTRRLSPLCGEYPSALSIMLAYEPPSRPDDEETFFHILEDVRSRMSQITAYVSRFLDRRDISHAVVPQGGQDQKTLKACFSHKSAAVLAGLGWIGKNCLFVTPEFGPRVSLATILIGRRLPPGTPITKSLCGTCAACVEACPGRFITGLPWRPGTPRENLLDAHRCNNFREGFWPLLGRKSECGRCLLVCPQGR